MMHNARAGRPKDRGSILGKGKEYIFFFRKNVQCGSETHSAGMGALYPGAKLTERETSHPIYSRS